MLKSDSSAVSHSGPLEQATLEAEFERCCGRVRPAPDMRAPASEILQTLVRLAGATRASLMLINPDTGRLNMAAAVGLPEDLIGRDMPPRPRSISEWVFQQRRGLVLNGEVRDERFDGTSRSAVTESSMCVPIETAGGPLGVLSLARHSPASAFTDDDLATLARALPPMAEVILAVWRGERAERNLQRLEVADAAPGRTMVPIDGSHIRNYQLALARRPSWNLGGDLCDRVPHPNGGNTLMVVDVSGGGAFAALAAGFAQGLFVGAAAPERSAAGIVAQLNGGLHSRLGDGRFVALWLAQFARNGEVAYCNAGYPPPFWVPADGSPTLRLDRGGPVAGAFAQTRFEEERVRLLPGDLVVTVSDGVLGERDAADQAFGAERVAEMLQERRREPLDRVVRDVCEAARGHSGRSTPTDDFLVLALRYRPEN